MSAFPDMGVVLGGEDGRFAKRGNVGLCMPTFSAKLYFTRRWRGSVRFDVDTAVVNSPNGLWLREVPGGTQEVELIPDGTVLTVLPGRETVDDLEWQQVRTPAGSEGWVAVDFIIYQSQVSNRLLSVNLRTRM